MTKTIFVAAAFTLALSLPAFAQGSGTGDPNTLHGSGNMMQDGPHAAAPPASTADLPSGMTRSERNKACQAKWDEAVANHTTGDRSKSDFLKECGGSS